MSELRPTAIASPNYDYKPLERNILPELGEIKVVTSKGELTLNEYMVHPLFRAQAVIFIHKGKVVYESYPGIKRTDRKIWASSAKTMVGLILAMLVEEGKVDLDKPISEYVPELKDTAWDGIIVRSVANMTTGLDNEETYESIMNPNSSVVRFFTAGIGAKNPKTGKAEDWLLDVARSETKIEGEEQGKQFRYASMNTTVLTQLIENVEDKMWIDIFEERVWSKVYARQSAFFNLTDSGTALPVGFLSTTPEDMARFATLFTPSWKTVASEKIATPALIERIRAEVDEKRYIGTAKEETSKNMFNEVAIGNGYQFDYIFSDGAIAKSGNMNQMIYMDPNRDFAAIALSSSPYHSGFGEFKAPAYMRKAAKMLADK